MSADGVEAVRFPVEGMTCSSCVGRITRAVRKVDGVHGVHVDLRTGQVTVRRLAGTAPTAELEAAIRAAGYGTGPAAAVASAPERTLLERLLRR